MSQKSYKRVSGVWKEAKEVWMKISGVWEDRIIPWIKISGTWKICHVLGNIIVISQASFAIGWRWKDGDFFGITVWPPSMDWTATIEDTGDGTAWVAPLPATGTGSLAEGDIKVYAYEENTTGNMRTADVRFSDDSSVADDVVITVTQEANPV